MVNGNKSCKALLLFEKNFKTRRTGKGSTYMIKNQATLLVLQKPLAHFLGGLLLGILFVLVWL